MENDKDFIKLLETYTDYRGDDNLRDLILDIYRYIQSNPSPEKWLKSKVDELNVDLDKDFLKQHGVKLFLTMLSLK